MQTSDYKQLKVWQKAMDLTMEIYRLVKFLPREETYALSDQLRRAVVSIPSNIAEGHGRGTDKEFVKFLWIARGSLLEVETQLIICNRLALIKVEESNFAQSLIVEVGKMLNALITYRTNKSNT
ncbi:four helix bundle protein [uncultured Muribaculum sp.]|uniref:four helix bundle protein n=1 Tax=uncultured Muribaculum sp. TaxID=1918613 RepID=UPI002731D9B9|nr:four helix bundle protein [uncultured Muribaculum sp.]